ncbi:MAG: pre-rRNA-processing protein esf1, partial [Watsoniomyces obsoletus]
MRELLGLKSEATSTSKSSKKDKAPVGNVQITFSAGLSGNNTDDKKRSVFVNTEEEANETTLEKYVRKEKERKQKRRDRAKIPRTGEELAADSDEDAGEAMGITMPASKEDEDGDQGFDDPFFTAPTTDATVADSKTTATKLRKEERLKKRREREEAEEKSAKQRAELENLMADDADDHDAAEGHDGVDGRKGKMRHFDMRDIEKTEKLERKKSKSKKEKKRQKRNANKAG